MGRADLDASNVFSGITDNRCKNGTSCPSHGLDDDLIARKAFVGLFSANLTTGEVRYVDPQSGNNDVNCYFDKFKPSETGFARINDRTPLNHRLLHYVGRTY